MGYQELETKTETNVCCPVCNKKCLVSLIKTRVECCLNKNNGFVVQTEIIISGDETDSNASQKASSMSLYPEESPLNLNDRKQLIENIKKSLEKCEIGQKERHLLISVQRGYCFYNFTRFFKSCGTRAAEIFIRNSCLWENVEQLKVVSVENFIQVMLLIHANRLQKHFLVSI